MVHRRMEKHFHFDMQIGGVIFKLEQARYLRSTGSKHARGRAAALRPAVHSHPSNSHGIPTTPIFRPDIHSLNPVLSANSQNTLHGA
jgi:hypothetical protein